MVARPLKFEEVAKRRLLVVGAFPEPGSKVVGGVVTACRELMRTSFPSRFVLKLIDSTQKSNPPPPLGLRAFYAGKRVLGYLSQFERFRPEAVLIFTSSGAGLIEKGLMAWYARMRNVPCLVFPRGGELLRRWPHSIAVRWIGKAMLYPPDKILCQGTAWREFVVEELGRSSGEAPIVPNWTASSELLAIGAARAAQRGNSPLRLVYVGWVEREKGIFELLEACELLMGGEPYTLDIVGDGTAMAQARRCVVEKGLGHVVRFCGWLERGDVNMLLGAADILVLPSWREGMPNVVLEAMAARVAVIASAVGSVGDVICDGRTGLLVQPADSRDLLEAMRRLLMDENLRIGIAQAAHESVATCLNPEAIVARLVDEILDVTRR